MNRTILMIRSVGFALVAKTSGGAMVFIALPIVAHGLPAVDYASFLTTVNIVAAVGLVFAPFGMLYIRELAHAFASENPARAKTAIKNTFGIHAILTLTVFTVVTIGFLAAGSFIPLRSSMLLGLVLNITQIGAGWAQVYRVAERSDYVTSLVQMICNISMAASLVVLSMTNQMTDFSV
ncbi:hypothetical protein L0337_00780, partial [candidate division KSB1 bacterium]|nr:hypothetical protein [candidate division KSB1 bacterium]